MIKLLPYILFQKCIYILASEMAIAQVTSTVPIVSTYCRSLLRLSSTYPILGWLGSRVVSVLDSGSEGPGFKSQPRRCRVTVLGKLFTPIVPLFTKQQNWQQPSLRVAGVTAGLAESNGSLPPGLHHLQADCQEPGPAPEPYAR